MPVKEQQQTVKSQGTIQNTLVSECGRNAEAQLRSSGSNYNHSCTVAAERGSCLHLPRLPPCYEVLPFPSTGSAWLL